MTSENVAEQDAVESAAAVSAKAVDDQLIDELVSRVRVQGLRLTGEGGLLQLTKRLLESALEGEITGHLGYDKQIRDGAVANRPIHVALAVTVEGRREILGLWAGDGGEGAKHWLHILTEIKNRGVNDVLMLVCDGPKGLPEAVTSRPPCSASTWRSCRSIPRARARLAGACAGRPR